MSFTLFEPRHFSQIPMGEPVNPPRIKAMVIRSSSIKRQQLDVKVQTQASASWWSQVITMVVQAKQTNVEKVIKLYSYGH